MCQWIALLNPVKLPLSPINFKNARIPNSEKRNQELGNKFLAWFSRYNPACDNISNNNNNNNNNNADNFYGVVTQHMPLQGRLDKQQHTISELSDK
jgi:hypothetical protein